jgi:hypothetical protein
MDGYPLVSGCRSLGRNYLSVDSGQESIQCGKTPYLKGLCPPDPPEFSALAADARGEQEEGRASVEETAASGVPPTAGRSGRTPAEPYPPDGEADDTKKGRRRPAEDHPWRKPYQRRK